MKNFKSSIVKLVKVYCPFIKNNSKQNNGSEHGKRGLYYDFSPIDVCVDEDKSSYEEEFNQIKYALENDKVKNLAILGKFGTGKSSLISSFFKHAQINNKKISEKEYVTVSLADFDYLKENSSDNIEDDRSDSFISGNNNSDTTDQEKSNPSSENIFASSSKNNQSSSKSAFKNLDAVEKEIIRQLSYGKLSKNIPISFLSKFKDDFWDNFIISIYLSTILIFFLCSLFKRNFVELIISFSLSNLQFFIPIVFCYFFVFVYYLLPNLRVKKFSLSFFNLENRDKDNVIDTYLDEITHLFEQSKCKFVIFEDLDRGNNPEVFTHLRNLNFVLNNDIRCKNGCFGKRCQRRIVFIYLLRNDLLSPQEMVKFFDYTLSITPYAASSNIAFHALKIREYICEYYKKLEEEKTCETDKTSEYKLEASQKIEDHDQTDKQYVNAQKSSETKIFKKSELFTEEALDNDFIITVSRFVGDLRNIKQIFNDYQLLIGNFEFLFDDAKSIGKKIFSISVLKNYYPCEYNELTSNKGKLYELLNREDALYIDDVENKKSNSKTQSVIEENKIITDPDLCATTKKIQLLNYLLTSNLLSKDYRFYVSKFSKKFCLDKNQFSFLRNVYDKNSIYEPNYEIISKKNELDILLSFLPDYAVSSKAILNYHLFSFLLHNYINYQSVINNYIGVIFKGKYKQQGYIFLLELCSFLNEELKNKNKIKLNDQTKLNILTYLFIKSNDNIKDVIDNLDNPVQKSEFLLFILVYGIQQNLSNIINSNNNSFNGFNSLIKVKAYSTYILKGLNNIPQMYWKYLFSSLRYLLVELEYAPTSKILGGNLKEFYFILDQWLTTNDGSKNKSLKYYLPFKINCENCSALANFLTSCLKEFTKNTDSQDLNCSNSFLSVLFDFKSEDKPSFLNIRKTIFNYIFEQNQFTEKNRYLRLLSVSSVIDKFNNLSKDESVTYLEDEPSIVFSFLTIITSLENELKVSHDFNEDIVINADEANTYNNLRNEFYALLQKYDVGRIFKSEVNSIKACFLDFENICCDDFSVLLDKASSLLQIWHDSNLFELFPKALNFELAKVVVISDFLRYSYLNKVNQKTPRHRVLPNLKNVLFVRDYLMSFNLSDSITDSSHLIPESLSPIKLEVFKMFDSAWNSLYEFFKQNFDEISQSSSHSISCPKFEDFEPNRINKIKKFFLNLDKQD